MIITYIALLKINRINMRKLTYLALCAAIITIASCSKKDPTPTPAPVTPAAKVKFINTCLNAASLSVQINDVTLTTVPALAFLGISNYVNVTPGASVKTSFIFPNTVSPLITPVPVLSYTDGSYYSVFAVGSVSTPSIVFTSDNVATPASGMFNVRMINLSLDSLSYDFYVAPAGRLDSNVTYKVTTPFRQIAAGDRNVIIQDPHDVQNQVTLNAQHFEAGKAYTILVTGSKNFANEAALKATVIANN